MDLTQGQQEDFNELLNEQIINASCLLQSASRIMGKPLVLCCRAPLSPEAELDLVSVSEDAEKPDDLIGITIAVACGKEAGEELTQAFEEIMKRHHG